MASYKRSHSSQEDISRAQRCPPRSPVKGLDNRDQLCSPVTAQQYFREWTLGPASHFGSAMSWLSGLGTCSLSLWRHCCYSSGGKRTCMPPLETRTDSPGETPEVPQDPCQHWRGILRFRPRLHTRSWLEDTSLRPFSSTSSHCPFLS